MDATEANAQFVVGYGITVTKLTIRQISAPANPISYTLRKNGVNTALTVLATATAGTFTGTGSIAFSAGDFLSVIVVISAGAGVITSATVSI